VKSIGSGRCDGAGPAPPTRSLREERLLRSVEHGSTPKSLPRAAAPAPLHLVIRRISLVSEQARMGRMLRDEHL
jgi:hypothetical protein